MSWPANANGVACFASDGPAVGVWKPDKDESVLALVCAEHAARALAQRFGPVRLFGQRVWHTEPFAPPPAAHISARTDTP